MIRGGGAVPVVVLTKADLSDNLPSKLARSDAQRLRRAAVGSGQSGGGRCGGTAGISGAWSDRDFHRFIWCWEVHADQPAIGKRQLGQRGSP